MEFILLLVMLLTVIGILIGMMAVSDDEPVGYVVVIACGLLLWGTLASLTDYNALKDKAADYEQVVVQKESLEDAMSELQSKYGNVLMVGREAKTALVKKQAQLKDALGNLEKAKSDLEHLTVAKGFCDGELELTKAVNSELEEDLRVSQGQLTTVRNLIRGN